MSYTHFLKLPAEAFTSLNEENYSILKPKYTIREGDEIVFDNDGKQIKTKVEFAEDHAGLKQGYQFIYHKKIK